MDYTQNYHNLFKILILNYKKYFFKLLGLLIIPKIIKKITSKQNHFLHNNKIMEKMTIKNNHFSNKIIKIYYILMACKKSSLKKIINMLIFNIYVDYTCNYHNVFKTFNIKL